MFYYSVMTLFFSVNTFDFRYFLSDINVGPWLSFTVNSLIVAAEFNHLDSCDF